ncbi:LOW QUALITY PROTEIN: inactive leucine-rich repeat receptor-like serine/threonine-protein kinase At1g60630 [Dioscorea cayenensis subsp. rotundata]|uniref:LOW QUALITY PROTEIN: inactive leucine-rich repeat receptor-like serine/threonine-protein kinase At1g60630 n=1 Tax=Dioscorea cayennensis subsp. rotundata TaxID=55577 RepID=A0AB40C6P5_DIOCR|nr:LOW QUALITY PROTEIN: inactive leucine-rich repeat receptor-like serine/threonine-protein kinase At1g60630 [Dioscorea cayenensis subsp. rotundata]
MAAFSPPLLLLLPLFLFPHLTQSTDADALLAFKLAVDPHNSLPWRRATITDLCSPSSPWLGVKECSNDGRVTKLVLEFLNLTGVIPIDALTPLAELRVLSLKSNSFTGLIPDLSHLSNLKSLYLNFNRFSGHIPSKIAELHRLKVIVLSDNLFSGDIPPSLTTIPRLYVMLLQNNRLSGTIPPFNQSNLRFFNVSGNALYGEIPTTRSLSRFNLSSFSNNPSLCGAAIKLACSQTPLASPSEIPFIASSPLSPSTNKRKKNNKKKLIGIIAGSTAGALLLAVLLIILLRRILKSNNNNQARRARSKSTSTSAAPEIVVAGGGGGGDEGGPSGEPGKRGEVGKRGFAWESEGLGKLVFCGGNGEEMYSLEDLLRASAETLGRGTTGSTYKAVMETGFIVTVKRLKDSGFPGFDEFRARIEEVGRVRHPNLVPLRAYFQAKEERLLVYDYFPNGSLFSLIHGTKQLGAGKPLHWTSCLKIAEDVATGLLYLHTSSPPMLHGNLKSSNVLLGPDFESCLTDYSLIPNLHPPISDDPLPSSSLFYRAPECRHNSTSAKNFTHLSDMFSFGVLLLELLTGKTPFQDLVEQHGADIARWVRSVREEEMESGDETVAVSGNEGSEEKLGALVNVAMACVSVAPERRPGAKEVLKMIREARAEALVSSNSSDHSPARWSDTVQSLPRELGSDHSERD